MKPDLGVVKLRLVWWGGEALRSASMCSLTLVWGLPAWGFFVLITENKRLKMGHWRPFVRALITAIYLCFSYLGNCDTGE